MALQPVNLSEIPDIQTRVSIVPRITIADNGQIRPNKAAINCVNGKPESLKFAQVLFDSDTRQMGVALVAKAPKGVNEADLAKLAHNKNKDGSLKGNPPYFGAAKVLRQIGYDYRRSGTQTFDAEFRDGLLVISVPEGALTPKPKRERKPKDEAAQPAQPAEQAA